MLIDYNTNQIMNEEVFIHIKKYVLYVHTGFSLLKEILLEFSQIFL